MEQTAFGLTRFLMAKRTKPASAIAHTVEAKEVTRVGAAWGKYSKRKVSLASEVARTADDETISSGLGLGLCCALAGVDCVPGQQVRVSSQRWPVQRSWPAWAAAR